MRLLSRRALVHFTAATVFADLGTVSSSSSATAAGKVTPMSDDRFWTIVDSTATYEAQPEAQLNALRSALGRLSAEEIEAFQATLGDQLKRSYTWDLWGADYVIHGGASDDAFEYFRRWLISKGQRVFEKVLADPDSLADILVADSQGPLEFEEFAYAAGDAWSKKTGRSANQMPDASETAYAGSEPSGVPFEEDEAALSARYPKLWKRFGKNPLF